VRSGSTLAVLLLLRYGAASNPEALDESGRKEMTTFEMARDRKFDAIASVLEGVIVQELAEERGSHLKGKPVKGVTNTRYLSMFTCNSRNYRSLWRRLLSRMTKMRRAAKRRWCLLPKLVANVSHFSPLAA
jgi:hypothetical protein